MVKYYYGLMYKEELGGGAQLLYDLNGKDWLWNERKRWLDIQKRKIGMGVVVAL